MPEDFARAYRELGVPGGLPPAAEPVFAVWFALLIKWNARINLTRVTDPRQVVARHLLDCLPLAGALSPGTLLDIGSGAGVPGLIVAALRPEVAVTCAESINKKAAFLRQAAAAMGLTNVVVAADRAEALAGPYAAVTARAVAAPEELIRRYGRLVVPGGVFACFVTEAFPPPPGFAVERDLAYTLPEGGGARRLVLLRGNG